MLKNAASMQETNKIQIKMSSNSSKTIQKYIFILQYTILIARLLDQTSPTREVRLTVHNP